MASRNCFTRTAPHCGPTTIWLPFHRLTNVGAFPVTSVTLVSWRSVGILIFTMPMLRVPTSRCGWIRPIRQAIFISRHLCRLPRRDARCGTPAMMVLVPVWTPIPLIICMRLIFCSPMHRMTVIITFAKTTHGSKSHHGPSRHQSGDVLLKFAGVTKIRIRTDGFIRTTSDVQIYSTTVASG